MEGGAWGQQAHLYPQMSGMHKRPRPDYDLPPSGMASGIEIRSYLVRDDDRRGSEVTTDTKTIGSAYDRYLQSAQVSSYRGEGSNFSGAPFGRAIPMVEQSMVPNGQGVVFGDKLIIDTMARPVRESKPLPTDASNTLYVECLPSNCTKREVAHIFRPFVGYKEVRLVTKESKHRGGDPLILCFVDFVDAACAATALTALQGYKMDEDNPDSSNLRIQFSRHPGPRSGGGPRGRR